MLYQNRLRDPAFHGSFKDKNKKENVIWHVGIVLYAVLA